MEKFFLPYNLNFPWGNLEPNLEVYNGLDEGTHTSQITSVVESVGKDQGDGDAGAALEEKGLFHICA